MGRSECGCWAGSGLWFGGHREFGEGLELLLADKLERPTSLGQFLRTLYRSRLITNGRKVNNHTVLVFGQRAVQMMVSYVMFDI